jgi:hypothetical protein
VFTQNATLTLRDAYGVQCIVLKTVTVTNQSNWTGAFFTYSQGNITPTAGSSAAVHTKVVQGQYQPEEIGGIWSDKVWFRRMHSFEDTPTTAPVNTPRTSPSISDGIYYNYSGQGNGVGHMSIIRARANNTSVFGYNSIALVADSYTNCQAVGMEIDVEYSLTATTDKTGAGLFINVFNEDEVGAAIQVEAAGGGGSWSNGYMIKSVYSAGCLFGALSGASCAQGLNLDQGTFSDAAILLSRTQTFKAGAAFNSNGDTSNNYFMRPGTALYVDAPTATENVQFFGARRSGGETAVAIYTASGGGIGNAAGAPLKVNSNSSTSRSINAQGTINASGADFAEFEYKSAFCGDIAKGAIVGFDANGHLTDRFDDAVWFRVKSTDPSLVGGDTYDQEFRTHSPEPTRPEAPRDPLPPPKKGQTIHYERFKDQIEGTYAREMAEYEADQQRHASEMAVYDAAMNAWRADHAAWTSQHDQMRACVDRIAKVGRFPCNITGATVGQLVIPSRNSDGSIGGVLVTFADADWRQCMAAVGVVRSIKIDGRAEVEFPVGGLKL